MFSLRETLVVLSEVDICALCLLGVLVEDRADIVKETVCDIFGGFGLSS